LDNFMLALMAIAALVGAILAMRFKVFALVPATVLLLVAVLVIGLAGRGLSIWWIGVMMFAAATSLQLGYLGASLLQMALPGNRRRREPISGDNQTHPEAPPLAPHQPDRDIAIGDGRSEENFPTDTGAVDQSVGPPADRTRRK
jgi:hypothetical protein